MNAQETTVINNDPAEKAGYAARLNIDYPETLNRLTSFFRLFTIIPIAIILGMITDSGANVTKNRSSK